MCTKILLIGIQKPLSIFIHIALLISGVISSQHMDTDITQKVINRLSIGLKHSKNCCDKK